MATTTNYGWVTPDDTDLVKDGAAAIRTLGSSVDTSFVNLLGGTTGQVLTKASGTNLDFSFATPASGGMTLISTTTLTGASVTLSAIPGTFNNLQLVIQNFRPAADNTLKLRINGDSATRYTNVSGTNEAYSQTSISIATQQQESSVASQHLSVTEIPNYANTTTWKQTRSVYLNNGNVTSTNVTMATTTGAFNQIGAITSLVLFPDSGNFTSGTALLYGVK